MDNQLMLVIGNIEISWFAVFTTIACYTGMMIACILRRIQQKRVSDVYVSITFGLPLGLLFGRLLYLFFSGSGLTGLAQYADITNGGSGLYGVILGVFCGALIAAKLYGVDDFGQLLDCLSVGGAFAIAVGRFATVFTASELGYEVGFKTFAVHDSEQDIYNLAVYKLDGIYEALIFTLCLWFFVYCIRKCDRKKISGKTALLMLSLHGTNQVVMESMRADPLKLGINEFIKISQILGITCCVAVLIAFIVLTVKQNGFGKFHIFSFAVIIVAIVLGVFGEYRVGSSNYISNHLIMFAGMVLLDWLTLEYALKTVEHTESLEESASQTEKITESSDDSAFENPVAETARSIPQNRKSEAWNDLAAINVNAERQNNRLYSDAKIIDASNGPISDDDLNMDSLMLELDNIK